MLFYKTDGDNFYTMMHFMQLNIQQKLMTNIPIIKQAVMCTTYQLEILKTQAYPSTHRICQEQGKALL